MFNHKLTVAFSLGLVLSMAFVVRVLAVDYNPGVTTGQYVKYGNFVGIGEGLESFNDVDWLKLEVIDVSGKEVKLLTIGILKNGTAFAGNGSVSVWNVETGALNGIPSVQGPIIAANLNEGDAIPPPNTYVVNKTEDRMYLEVSRSVNILRSEISSPSYVTVLTFVYDRDSGMLMEALSETTRTQPAPSTSKYSYSVIETNLSGSPTHPTPTPETGIPVEYFLVTVALVVVGVVVAFAVFTKRAK
jgi:hypothetical protein